MLGGAITHHLKEYRSNIWIQKQAETRDENIAHLCSCKITQSPNIKQHLNQNCLMLVNEMLTHADVLDCLSSGGVGGLKLLRLCFGLRSESDIDTVLEKKIDSLKM